MAGFVDHGMDLVFMLGWIDDDFRPIRIGNIAMPLAIKGVGLEESYVMAALVKCANDSAIISGSPVPVGGDQAGTKEGNIQSVFHFKNFLTGAPESRAIHLLDGHKYAASGSCSGRWRPIH